MIHTYKEILKDLNNSKCLFYWKLHYSLTEMVFSSYNDIKQIGNSELNNAVSLYIVKIPLNSFKTSFNWTARGIQHIKIKSLVFLFTCSHLFVSNNRSWSCQQELWKSQVEGVLKMIVFVIIRVLCCFCLLRFCVFLFYFKFCVFGYF